MYVLAFANLISNSFGSLGLWTSESSNMWKTNQKLRAKSRIEKSMKSILAENDCWKSPEHAHKKWRIPTPSSSFREMAGIDKPWHYDFSKWWLNILENLRPWCSEQMISPPDPIIYFASRMVLHVIWIFYFCRCLNEKRTSKIIMLPIRSSNTSQPWNSWWFEIDWKNNSMPFASFTRICWEECWTKCFTQLELPQRETVRGSKVCTMESNWIRMLWDKMISTFQCMPSNDVQWISSYRLHHCCYTGCDRISLWHENKVGFQQRALHSGPPAKSHDMLQFDRICFPSASFASAWPGMALLVIPYVMGTSKTCGNRTGFIQTKSSNLCASCCWMISSERGLGLQEEKTFPGLGPLSLKALDGLRWPWAFHPFHLFCLLYFFSFCHVLPLRSSTSESFLAGSQWPGIGFCSIRHILAVTGRNQNVCYCWYSACLCVAYVYHLESTKITNKFFAFNSSPAQHLAPMSSGPVQSWWVPTCWRHRRTDWMPKLENRIESSS